MSRFDNRSRVSTYTQSWVSNADPDFGAFESIATTTLTTSTATVTFSSIPATYKHLQIRMLGRTTASAISSNVQITFNSDTTAGNYTFHRLIGDGTSASSYGQSGLDYIILFAGGNAASNIFGVGVLDIVDYANTNKFKTTKILTGLERNSGTEDFVMFRSQLWRDTSAITSITFTPSSGNLAQYSSFALYGIKG